METYDYNISCNLMRLETKHNLRSQITFYREIVHHLLQIGWAFPNEFKALLAGATTE